MSEGSEDLSLSECGPHCGQTEEAMKHCPGCHAPTTHGNARFNGRTPDRKNEWSPQ